MHDASLSKAGGDNITSHIAMSAIFSQLQGERGGFEFVFSTCHRVNFLNELLTHHTSKIAKMKGAQSSLTRL
jgi:hypothetical protein